MIQVGTVLYSVLEYPHHRLRKRSMAFVRFTGPPLAPLGDLLRRAESGALSGAFAAHGLEGGDADKKAALVLSAARMILSACGACAERSPACAFWVPGRVEIVGKHTDYAGGRSLLCAAPLGLAAVVVPREDDACIVHASWAEGGGAASAPTPARLSVCVDAAPPDAAPWALYPAAALRRLALNFDIRGGAEVACSPHQRRIRAPQSRPIHAARR